MATRIVEGKKPYTGGKAITVDENKVISLNLREENNLIIYDAGDDEIYVDLQLPDGITPLDAFPVGITVGRVLVADDWDVTGTLACFKTTSGDNIKLLYGDNGKVYIDNGTGLFKQIYLKGEVDALLQALRDYVDAQLALKQDLLIAGDYIEIDDNVISAVIPTMSRFLSIWNASSGEPISFPASTPFLYTTGDYYLIEGVGVSDNYRPAPIEYDGSASTILETEEVANGDVYIYDGAVWLLQSNHGKTVTFQNIAGDPYDNTNLATALNAKQNTLVSGTNIKSINNQSILGNGDLSIAEVPSGGTNGQVLTQTSQGPSWQNATGGAEIEYKTQAEYNALPSSKLTDGKHYFIYSTSGGGWQPGVNTVLYLPVDSSDTSSTVYDHSTNGTDFTWYGTADYDTLTSGKKVLNLTGSNGIYIDTALLTSGPFTVSYFMYINGSHSQEAGIFVNQYGTPGNGIVSAIINGDFTTFMGNGSNWIGINYSDSISNMTWVYITIIYESGTLKRYINGQLVHTISVNASFNYLLATSFGFTRNIGDFVNTRFFKGKIGDMILEDKVRTAQEIVDYFDQTKGNYGIS